MRAIVCAGLIVMAGACARVPDAPDRQAEAFALARQRAEASIDISIGSFTLTHMIEFECNDEVGLNARQRRAFEARMEDGLKTLKANERPKALADMSK